MHIITQGVVLRSAQYSESDRMVTLLTPQHGRMEAIARGSRRPKSPLVAAVEPFCAGEYTLYAQNGRVSIQQCRVMENFYHLRFDVDRLTCAAYCAALCEASAQEEEDCRDMFALLLKTLAYLENSDLPLPLLTAAFEMRLMPLLGYLPRLDTCVQCGKAFQGGGRFDARLGGAVCPDCPSTAPEMSLEARRILYKAPRTDYTKVDLLQDHPAWQEAARLYRPFVRERIDLPEKRIVPPLPEEP